MIDFIQFLIHVLWLAGIFGCAGYAVSSLLRMDSALDLIFNIALGLAFVAFTSFFLSQLGLISVAVLLFEALITLGLLRFLWQFPNWRLRLFRPAEIVISFAIPVFLSIFILYSFAFSRSYLREGDLWGSMDLFSYWSTANFLRYFPFSPNAYMEQTIFHYSDSFKHIALYGRGGVMTLLAVIGSFDYSSQFQYFINPLIFLNQLLATCFLCREFAKQFLFPRLGAVAIAVSPFCIFPIFLSYLSQALALSLLLIGLLWLKRCAETKVGDFVGLSMILLGGSLVFEATAPLFVMLEIYALWIFYQTIRKRTARVLLLLSTIPPFFFNLPTVVQRMCSLGGAEGFPGWNWRYPPGLLPALGISSSVLDQEYWLPLWGLLALQTCLAVLIAFGAWRLRTYAIALIFVLLLSLPALLLMTMGVPHASHMLVKSITLVGPLLSAYALLGLQSIWRNPEQRLAVGLSFGIVIFAGLQNSVFSPFPAINLPRELTRTVESIKADADKIFISQNLNLIYPEQVVGSILGNDLMVKSLKETDCPQSYLGNRKAYYLQRIACPDQARYCYSTHVC